MFIGVMRFNALNAKRVRKIVVKKLSKFYEFEKCQRMIFLKKAVDNTVTPEKYK